MALVKPIGVTEATVCSGENISSIQTNLIFPPVPTILGCRGDAHASAVPSPPRCQRCSPGREGTHAGSHHQEGRFKQSVYARWLLLICFKAASSLPLRWDAEHAARGSADTGKSYIAFNSSCPTFSSAKLSQLTSHAAPFLLHKIFP